MTSFFIRFLISNIYISAIIGVLFAAKRIFKNSLSCRMQYNLWYVLLGLLAIPFLPVKPIRFLFTFLWPTQKYISPSITNTVIKDVVTNVPTKTVDWMNDFTLSVSKVTPSIAGIILCVLWSIGIFIMIILAVKSRKRLRVLIKSALPLQNRDVQKLYENCLAEMNINQNIPIYSTAFLKSPVIVGFLHPSIFLPIHLISDYHPKDMRYILLHELHHYKRKDTLTNYLMNTVGVVYWFNPFVWYALREMRNDREVACDTSVLEMLTEDAYVDYGNALINFAEKISLTPFPFTAGFSSNMNQMKRRILNIAAYEKPSLWKKLKSASIFLLTVTLLISVAPALSTYAADKTQYKWISSSENISYVDLSDYFGTYDGSFVLHDLENDSWQIHNLEYATMRTSPDSTYKIYEALLGLEQGIITPDNSFIAWDNEQYPFDSWNNDQTLSSAMESSVNWYFQTIDKQLGMDTINTYIHDIDYGNKIISNDLSTYWLESSLKISPMEQVELLTKLYNNSFNFSPQNIHAVKESIRLSSSKDKTLSGKTGTGRVNGADVNGWFIGYVETPSDTYFFAVNIIGDTETTGSKASEIALSILSDINIWN